MWVVSAAIKPNHDHKFTRWSGKSRGEASVSWWEKNVSLSTATLLSLNCKLCCSTVCVWVSYQKMSLFMRAWIQTHLTSTTSTTSSHLPPRILFMTGLTVFDGLWRLMSACVSVCQALWPTLVLVNIQAKFKCTHWLSLPLTHPPTHSQCSFWHFLVSP